MGELGDCVYPQALKISGSDGSELWRWVGDTTEGWKYYPRISDFAPARGGGVIAVGYKNPEDIWWGNQAYVMRLDGLGNLDTSFYFTDSLQFLDKHGQRFYLDSQLYSIQLLNDDNYLLYGKRLLNNRQSYSWFVKVDPYFHKIWEKYYDKRDGRNVLFLTLDSRIVLVGQNILVIDASGDSLAGYKLADVEWEDGFELQSIGGIALDEKDDLYINCMGYIAPKRETGYQLLKLRLPLALVPARDPLQALSFTEEITIPKHLSISSIDPNPFNSSTRISYILPQSGSVTAALYGIDGRKVLDLMNEFQFAGTHTMTVNAGGLASGVYVLRVEAGANVAVQKLVLAK